jgi:hypothetical protein
VPAAASAAKASTRGKDGWIDGKEEGCRPRALIKRDATGVQQAVQEEGRERSRGDEDGERGARRQSSDGSQDRAGEAEVMRYGVRQAGRRRV